ncbi:MAG: hypothetical protein STHCBS139747_006148 [Sporothrix thermara]
MPTPTAVPFDSLPLRKDGPHGNAWGLFGDGNLLGMLNLLTPKTTASAAKEIVDGVRISTDLTLDRMKVPCFGRAGLSHTIRNKAPRSVNDDSLSFNTQISSQWDGFRHYGYQEEQLYYGGHVLNDLLSSDVIGIQAWAKNGGIVGRGVLLDYAAWATKQGLTPAAFETTAIAVETLRSVARYQGTEFKRGDILLVRTGWIKAFNALTETQCLDLAAHPNPPAIGLESSEAMLRFLWDEGFAAVAGDQPSLEAWPCQDKEHWLHEWLLAGWGMPIGELFDLEELSRSGWCCKPS